MLARVASSIYWMSRYVERAEKSARFIDVNLSYTLDPSITGGQQWKPLVEISGDAAAFVQRHGNDFSPERVLDFLVLDLDNPNSVLACLAKARENARMTRDVITADMWRHLNSVYLYTRRLTVRDLGRDRAEHTVNRIKQMCLLFEASVETSLSRNTAWEFAQLGRGLERADKTLRLLDVKYFTLLPENMPPGTATAADVVQWADLLRSLSALEMYRQSRGAIEAAKVAEFLVLDPLFPRSVLFCIQSLEASLLRLLRTDHIDFPHQHPVMREVGRLLSDLRYSDPAGIVGEGMHEVLDRLQARINGIDDAIRSVFFEPTRPVPPGPDANEVPGIEPAAADAPSVSTTSEAPAPTPTQSQSQALGTA